MTKDLFASSKLYYGFPVILLGYKDDQHGYNLTSISSSFSLGDMVVIGLGNGGNASKQILKHGTFTLNLPSPDLLPEVEMAGFISGQDKFALTGLSYTKASQIDAPLIDACPLSLECQLEMTQEFGPYLNITARILRRWLRSDLVADQTFQAQQLAPILFAGDEKERVYRQLAEGADQLGSFFPKKA